MLNFLRVQNVIMKTLNSLVDSMNKEEVRHLKLYLNRTSSKGARKDEMLFNYIRKAQENYDEERIQQKLYKAEDKNAFYRLKNRLTEDISKSLTLQYFHHSEGNTVLYNVALSRHFQQKRQYRLAFHYLNKAEKKANGILGYELLDLIYSDFIKLSHESLSVNPEEYIEKRKKNRSHLNQLQEIDDILAALIYRIKTSQNFSEKNYQIIDLLQKTVDDFSNTPNIEQSPVLRLKIYQSVSRILLQQHDYKSLEEYLLKTLTEFTKESLFDKTNHDTKLQMLTYLANTLNKNNKQEESLKYTAMLKESMTEFGGFLHDKYLLYYYNALVLNYKDIDKNKAIEILHEARENAIIRKTPLNMVIIYLQLALQYFDIKSFKQANKNIVRLKIDDGYKSLDKAFQLKINISELIIRYEMEDSDYVEYLIPQVRKEFKELLLDSNYERQKTILEVIERIIYVDRLEKDEQLMAKVNYIIGTMTFEEAADIDLINYNEWLSGKLK